MDETTDEILALIDAYQGVQKRNPMTSPAWQDASAKLAPLFAEMARRQKAGVLRR